MARLLSRNGAIAITAAISPYSEIRDEIRAYCDHDDVPFVEVFANATIEALTERDPKGLYKKALSGEIKNFTGVSDPYEAPENPEIMLRTDQETIDQSLEKIMGYLAKEGLVG